jgi:archaeal flagellar protein FlaI
MVYTQKRKLVEVIKEGDEEILKVNYESLSHVPSIEENPLVMADAIDKLLERPSASRITFFQRRNYNYNFDQTQMLMQVAQIYAYFVRGKAISLQNMGLQTDNQQLLAQRFEAIQYILHNLLRFDPLGAYMEIRRIVRRETISLKTMLQSQKESSTVYIRQLNLVLERLESTNLVKQAKHHLPGYKLGDRSIYHMLFKPTITPDFMFSKLMSSPPLDGKQLAIYKTNPTTDVTIFEQKDDLKKLYLLNPPEFKISEDKYELIDLAKKVLEEHQPRDEDFLDPQKMRTTFTNIGKDLLRELSQQRGLHLSPEELTELAEILVRNTIGFGLIELLLEDPKVQDLTINSPMGQVPIFLLHADYHECITNITPTTKDFESWATKFRLLSGRPLDQANPILDTEIILPKARSRLSIIGKPLNPYGYGMSFRRHRDTPWTLPLFIQNGMISALGAGLLSFTIDGARSHLVAGTRSSGKTSFLGSLLLEIKRKYRVLTIEDTLELPGDSMRKLGYNIQTLKVRSALMKGGAEVPADEGIRTSLRLGDSALIVGEIRSKEASALYEAMRIGASANVVAGTIHGDSPYGVFDRVVNDLEVPRTSFKATDIIVMTAPIQSASGLSKKRRVVSITEVRKKWEDDPLRERGFVDLMKYNAKTDQLEPTPDLINGDSEILKAIGGNVKEWVGNWDAIWNNIVLRGDLKKLLVEYANKANNLSLLEAKFSIKANEMMYRKIDEVKEEVGFIDTKIVKERWELWLKSEINKI